MARWVRLGPSWLGIWRYSLPAIYRHICACYWGKSETGEPTFDLSWIQLRPNLGSPVWINSGVYLIKVIYATSKVLNAGCPHHQCGEVRKLLEVRPVTLVRTWTVLLTENVSLVSRLASQYATFFGEWNVATFYRSCPHSRFGIGVREYCTFVGGFLDAVRSSGAQCPRE